MSIVINVVKSSQLTVPQASELKLLNFDSFFFNFKAFKFANWSNFDLHLRVPQYVPYIIVVSFTEFPSTLRPRHYCSVKSRWINLLFEIKLTRQRDALQLLSGSLRKKGEINKDTIKIRILWFANTLEVARLLL